MEQVRIGDRSGLSCWNFGLKIKKLCKQEK